MKFTDLIAPGVAALIGVIGSGLTYLGLRGTDRRDRESREKTQRADRIDAASTAAGYYEKLTSSLMKEREEREGAIRALEGKVMDLSKSVETLHDTIGHKDAQIAAQADQIKFLLEQRTHDQKLIEQLQGELRQTKQISASMSRVAQRETENQI